VVGVTNDIRGDRPSAARSRVRITTDSVCNPGGLGVSTPSRHGDVASTAPPPHPNPTPAPLATFGAGWCVACRHHRRLDWWGGFLLLQHHRSEATHRRRCAPATVRARTHSIYVGLIERADPSGHASDLAADFLADFGLNRGSWTTCRHVLLDAELIEIGQSITDLRARPIRLLRVS